MIFCCYLYLVQNSFLKLSKCMKSLSQNYHFSKNRERSIFETYLTNYVSFKEFQKQIKHLNSYTNFKQTLYKIKNKMGDFWKPTSDLFSGLIQKPKMTEKLLSKPPFKYIFDIIMQTVKKTNFGKGLYTGQQTNGDYYKDRDTKILFLAKAIQLTQMILGTTIQAKPQKIVAGLEPQNTNLMLQDIYKAATSGQNTDAYVKKVLGGGGAEQQQQQQKKKQPQNKKVVRPPSAARLKKPQDQPPSKKVVDQQPVEKQPPAKKQQQKKQPAKKEEYSKKVQQLQQQAEEEAAKQKKEVPKEEQPQQSKNKLGNLRKKKKNDKTGGDKIITSAGQLNEKELEMLQSMIQTICQNTAPLGKSIEFINDDVEAMNKQLQFWRRQYNASKTKMQAELKVSEQSLLPVYDKIAQIQDQIKDQKAKIQNAKAQIIKNDSTIKNLLMSVVTTK